MTLLLLQRTSMPRHLLPGRALGLQGQRPLRQRRLWSLRCSLQHKWTRTSSEPCVLATLRSLPRVPSGTCPPHPFPVGEARPWPSSHGQLPPDLFGGGPYALCRQGPGAPPRGFGSSRLLGGYSWNPFCAPAAGFFGLLVRISVY